MPSLIPPPARQLIPCLALDSEAMPCPVFSTCTARCTRGARSGYAVVSGRCGRKDVPVTPSLFYLRSRLSSTHSPSPLVTFLSAQSCGVGGVAKRNSAVASCCRRLQARSQSLKSDRSRSSRIAGVVFQSSESGRSRLFRIAVVRVGSQSSESVRRRLSQMAAVRVGSQSSETGRLCPSRIAVVRV